MAERLLLRSGRSGLVPIAVVWAGVAGWAMSAVFYGCFLGSHEPPTLLLALPGGLLSAIAAGYALRDDGNPTRVWPISVMAGALCPAVTIFLCGVAILIAAPILGSPDVGEVVGAMSIATAVGGLIGAPFGLVLGGVFGDVHAAAAVVLARCGGRGFAARELQLLWAGAGWLLLGISLAAVSRTLPPVIGFGEFNEVPTPGPYPVLALTGVGVATLGVFLTLGALGLMMARRWAATRARRGEIPGYVVLDARPNDPELPRLLTWGPRDAVLARRATRSEGPFRSDEGLERIACLPASPASG